MKKNLKQILHLSSLIAVMTLIMSSLAYADAATDYQKGLEDVASKVKGYAELIIVISAIFTSLMYMISFANPGARDMAKKSLYSLIIGVFMLVMYTNIASWIYNLMDKSPDKLTSAMKGNDKILKVKGKDIKDLGMQPSPAQPSNATPVTSTPPNDSSDTVKIGDFVGTNIVIDLDHIKEYSKNNQLKYLSKEQTKQAITLLDPLYSDQTWRSIRTKVINVSTTKPEQLGIIPDYSQMTITNTYTTQLIWEVDDLSKLSPEQLKTALDVLNKEKNNPTAALIGGYWGRCKMALNNAIWQKEH